MTRRSPRKPPPRTAVLARLWMLALLLAAAFVAPVPTTAPTVGWAAFPGADGRIAFERETPAGDHTQADVYTVRADGTGVVRLTRTTELNEFGPTWSADGSRIAFWRTSAPFGLGSLWVMRADGSRPRRLTTGIDARDPAWNPAGTRLVYQSDWDLHTLRVSDGGDRRSLTSGRALDFEPAWGPGGRRIAFTRGFATGDAGDLHVLDLDTGHVTRITHTPAYDHQVAWAPGGRRLVFMRSGDETSAIFSVAPDGTGLRRVTTGGHFDAGPAWSPDGTRVVFGSDRGGTFFADLWTVRPDGTELHRLLRLPYPENNPDWQPVP